MKSTGEGIALASNYEEALKKAFHTNDKRMNKREIVIADDSIDYKLTTLAAKVGVKLVQIKKWTSSWAGKETIALYNPNMSAEDQMMRQEAIKNRILPFTEKETLEAFLMSFTAGEWNTCSIEEWLEGKIENIHLEKGVYVG